MYLKGKSRKLGVCMTAVIFLLERRPLSMQTLGFLCRSEERRWNKPTPPNCGPSGVFSTQLSIENLFLLCDRFGGCTTTSIVTADPIEKPHSIVGLLMLNQKTVH